FRTRADKGAVRIAQADPRLLRFFQQVARGGSRALNGGLIRLVELLVGGLVLLSATGIQFKLGSGVVALVGQRAGAQEPCCTCNQISFDRPVHVKKPDALSLSGLR